MKRTKMYTKIKKDWIDARKAKDSGTTKVLGYLYSEIEAKKKRQGTIHNNDVVATIKNLVTKANELLSYDSTLVEAHKEIEILSTYLPKTLSEEKLLEVLQSPDYAGKSIGEVMKKLKEEYETGVDMRLASQMYKKVFP